MESGKTTNVMEEEFKYGKMVQDMKEYGRMEKQMVKAD